MAEMQQKLWGFSYADVGAILAHQWSLPNSLCAMIGCHLAPEQADDEYFFDSTLLHVAYSLKNHIFQGNMAVMEIVTDILARSGTVLKIDEGQILSVLAAVPEQAEHALELLDRG